MKQANNHKNNKIQAKDHIYKPVDNYFNSIIEDYREVENVYPFSYLTIPPTVKSSIAKIKLLAINSELIDLTHATEVDLIGDYSRELWIDIPFDYKMNGCIVYGGKWIDKSKIPLGQQHFYEYDSNKGYRLCVGVPESFIVMNNVILGCARTADHILTAYADFMSGRTDRIILKEYSHGETGINEYRKIKK